MRPHASRVRIPLWTVQLALLLASAALTVAVLWWALALLLSFGTYIESVAP